MTNYENMIEEREREITNIMEERERGTTNMIEERKREIIITDKMITNKNNRGS